MQPRRWAYALMLAALAAMYLLDDSSPLHGSPSHGIDRGQASELRQFATGTPR